ncbi:DUF3667 domain-containing protein [Ekhidna sp.]|uniref:DUF3667 domain-containing protein n=1 Tax=Ekhidna sp. TaxID=2608089 RepID=UPI003B5082AB
MENSNTKTTECKNCGRHATEKYCPNCGQKTNTDRFEWKHIGHQILDSVDFDKGFAHTLYLLLKRPGHAIRHYVSGGRIGFANPFKLFLIIGAFTNFLTFEFDTFSFINADLIALDNIMGFYQYSTKYFSFFTFTAIPLFSLFSWLVFVKRAYNLIEHYILNLYIGVGQFLILIVFIPIIFYSQKEEVLFVYGIVNFLYNAWVLMAFFRAYSLIEIVKIIVAITLPSITVFYYNYFIYKLSPQQLWDFLDRILA